MTRKPMMAGNWKMNKTYGEAVVLAQSISNNVFRDYTDAVDIVICAPSVNLKGVNSVFEFDKQDIAVGAQNVFYEESGAYTGEVSVPMIREVGCTYCIVGHSERREIFGETNEDVNKKVHALLDGKLKPIVCVGESLNVRESGDATEYVCAQVKAALAGVSEIDAKNITIAYEPIWAIGTGRTATPDVANEMCVAIRATVAEMFGDEVADGMRILYGGSMNPGNVEALIAQSDIDGGLIGGAALEADSFLQLVKACL
jgi:triosephosphate isomerase (TIM)